MEVPRLGVALSVLFAGALAAAGCSDSSAPPQAASSPNSGSPNAAARAQGRLPAPSPAASCPPPAPAPYRYLYLAYPPPGSRHVPRSLGALIVNGIAANYYGPTTVELTTQSGAAVPVGALGPAPSPLRTPLAAPPDYPQGPYYAASVPKLTPATVYYVSWTEFVYTGMPPKCAGPYTRPLGSFKTR